MPSTTAFSASMKCCGGRAEIHRARLRTVIALEAACDFEERARVRRERGIVPREVRRGGIGTGRQQRHDGRIVAAIPFHARDPRRVDLGDEITLLHARLDLLDDARMHLLDDARRDAHVLDLARRLHRALPVHERGCIDPLRLRQVLGQRRIRSRAEVVVVHLHADAALLPAARRDDFGRQIVHRMAHWRLHVVVRIADDVVVRHERRALRAVRILAATEPDRLAFHREQHALMHVERPAVVAGQPRHVGRVGHDHEIDARLLHRAPCLRDARVILAALERQAHGGHARLRPFLLCCI